jgi:hypothetical protein
MNKTLETNSSLFFKFLPDQDALYKHNTMVQQDSKTIFPNYNIL